MKVYLDASVLVALFTTDPFSDAAENFLRANAEILIISDFGAAEFASALGRRVRMKTLEEADAREAFANFDTWTSGTTLWAHAAPEDIAATIMMLRRLDRNLRAPDALHIAIARRLDATLMTFDVNMARHAEALGVAPAIPSAPS